MGLARFLATHEPVLDTGWRVALYPPGTTLADALAYETANQISAGFTVEPASATLLREYYIRGTSDTLPDGASSNDDDHGWRDTPTVLGTTCLRFRISGPGIHS